MTELRGLAEMQRFRKGGEVAKLLQRQIQAIGSPQLSSAETTTMKANLAAPIKTSYRLSKKNRFALMADGPNVEDGRNAMGGKTMQWNTPKIVEIACGCEINAYFPADL